MDKDTRIDIIAFIQTNEEKIKKDITAMITYGQLLYSCKPVDMYNRQPVDVYLRDTWVIIVDTRKSNVVTLYSIDLGVGRDFNEIYISRLLEQLTKAKDKYADAAIAVQHQTDEYSKLIKENENIIADYKKVIKSLQEQNEGYREVINNLQATTVVADKEVRDVVGTLIGKKVF